MGCHGDVALIHCEAAVSSCLCYIGLDVSGIGGTDIDHRAKLALFFTLDFGKCPISGGVGVSLCIVKTY